MLAAPQGRNRAVTALASPTERVGEPHGIPMAVGPIPPPRYLRSMRWLSMVAVLVAAAPTVALAQPEPTAPTPRAITVRVSRAIGGFDRDRLRRGLHKHAATCRGRRASGTVHLRLMLSDSPPRHGLRVLEARGDARLRRCLGKILPTTEWPTGSLDGIAEFTVTIRIAP